jgi:hypothetical protein
MIKFDLDQRVGDPFIKRPSFRIGTKFKTILSPVAPDFPVQKRALDREGRMRRKAFKLTGPTPRSAKTIEEIEALKTRQQGIKIRLGPGQFGKVRVAKRDAQGNIVKDDQGQIIYELKEFNLSMATLPLQDRLELLQDALLAGIKTPLNNIGIILASIFGSTDDVKNLTSANLRLLKQVLVGAREATGEPEIINPWDTDIFPDLPSERFVTAEAWRQNENNLQTRVQTFLLDGTAFNSNLDEIRPVFGIRRTPIEFTAINSQINITRDGDRVLDLGSRRLFKNQEQADAEAGEPAEIDFRRAERSSAAEELDDEKDELDPTAAGETEISQAITRSLEDPSDPNVLQNLSSAVQQRPSRSVPPRTLQPTAAPTPLPPRPPKPPRFTAPVASESLAARLRIETDTPKKDSFGAIFFNAGTVIKEIFEPSDSVLQDQRRRATLKSLTVAQIQESDARADIRIFPKS